VFLSSVVVPKTMRGRNNFQNPYVYPYNFEHISKRVSEEKFRQCPLLTIDFPVRNKRIKYNVIKQLTALIFT
jgi:hypothetical protein